MHLQSQPGSSVLANKKTTATASKKAASRRMAVEENFRRLVGKAGFGEVERVAAREVEIGIRGIREMVSRGIRRIREMGRGIRGMVGRGATSP